MKSWKSLIFGQIGSLIFMSPFAEKASVRLCHQYKSFSFDWIFLKVADKVSINEFKSWPDWIICLRVTSL